LTDGQRAALIQLLYEESRRGAELYFGATLQRVLTLQKALLSEINAKKLAVLTPVQKQKYEDMKGEKFATDVSGILNDGK
jgi:hypothetical protein